MLLWTHGLLCIRVINFNQWTNKLTGGEFIKLSTNRYKFNPLRTTGWLVKTNEVYSFLNQSETLLDVVKLLRGGESK